MSEPTYFELDEAQIQRLIQYFQCESVPIISLRDEFAKAALTGLLADPNVTAENQKSLADWCYKQADAMLEAREVKDENDSA